MLFRSVTSSVIRCQQRECPAVDHRCGKEFFFQTVRAAFALRRKTLCNSLCTSFGSRLGKEGVAAAIERCGLAPSIRGEALDMARFAVLADSLWEALGNP